MKALQEISQRSQGTPEDHQGLTLGQLQSMVNSRVVGIAIADAAGHVLWANDYYLDLVGFSSEELEAGKLCRNDLTPPEYLSVDEYAIQELRTRGLCTPYEKEYLRRDGSRVWALVADAMLGGSDKQIIAFVLNTNDRKWRDDEGVLEIQRMESLLSLNHMSDRPLDEIMAFAVEEGIRLTNSKIGYLAILNDEETVLTMQYWSKSAHAGCTVVEKPIVYPVEKTGLWGEAVRQRKPVITNDYSAPCPYKRGTPEGHVPITRHMNIPVFDGDRIVAVAGVGNKSDEYNERDVRQLQLLMDGWRRMIKQTRTRKELQQANIQTRRILESIPSILVSVDTEGRVAEWNPVAERVLGISATDAWGRRFDELEIVWEREKIDRAIVESHSTKQPVRVDDIRFTRTDGTEGLLGITIISFKRIDDADNSFLINASDITNRRKGEQTIANSVRHQIEVNRLQQELLGPGNLEEKLKKITAGVVQLFDADFCRIWTIKPGDLCTSGCVHAEVLEGPHVCRYRNQCLHLMASSGRYTHTDGKGHRRVPFGCYKIGRVAAEKEYKFLTNEVATDPRVHNHDWAKELGLVAFAGYRLCLPGGETIGVLALFSKHPITPEDDAMLEGMVNNATQVIQRARVEEEQQILQTQLVQAQRLESVGQLAAGIAHEINTPTQFVSDNTRFLGSSFPKLQELLTQYRRFLDECRKGPVSSDMVADLVEIVARVKLDYLLEQIPEAIHDSLEGLDRVTKIVRAMKDFSHPGQQGMCAANLNRAIESTSTVARNEWKYVADMVLELDPSLPNVPCMLGDFNQVILNLIVNAAHAIGDVVGKTGRGKGTITVTTSHDQDRAEIRIRDTGTGIPAENHGKIFNHFFTTKAVGKGTGQGLAMSRRVIVEKHGGTLTFETEMGKGTTFIIRLPLKQDVTTASEKAKPEEKCEV